MKTRSTLRLLTLLFSLKLVLSSVAVHATFIPVAVTGYNQDVVANGVGAASTSITADVDGVNYAFVAPDFQAVSGNALPTYHLPAGGTISSVQTSGLDFQLAAYNAPNALRLATLNSSGTLVFNTPVSAGEVYILGVTGSGSSTATITVNFTDLTTETFTGISFPDWYGGTGFAIQAIGRVKTTTNVLEGNTSDPRLYQRSVTLSSAAFSKQIASVTITKTASAGVLVVMGITINDVCNGTPVGGTTLSTAAAACPNTPFTLSLSGNSNGAGISYQWEYADAGQGNWQVIFGATNSTYAVTNQTVATDYRASLTCTNGGGQDFSALVSVAQNPSTACYCLPTYVNGGTGDHITNVTLESLSNASSGNPVPHYVDYTGLQPALLAIPDLNIGASYNLYLTFGTDPNQYSGVWIDYNMDGVFDATEFTSSFTNNTSGGSAQTVIQISIPGTASLGQTRMRVRGGDDSQPSATQACGASNSSYGEGEDYLVNITNNPLAISIVNIGAVNLGSKNRIDWTTAVEHLGDYFEVERSIDGHNYSKLAAISSKGSASSYSFIDEAPVSGVNYYRLRLMEASGKYGYSGVVKATVKQVNGFSIDAYPNPVSDELTVTAFGPQGADATISICDLTGKVLRTTRLDGPSVKVNMTGVVPGLYLVKYHDSFNSASIQVNKQ